MDILKPNCLAGGIIAVLLLSMVFPAMSVAQQTETQKAFEELMRLGDIALTPMNERAPAWVCRAKRASVCGAEGCSAGQVTIHLVVDYRAQAYFRCDAKGCDRYEMVSRWGGAYTVGQVPGRDFFFKALNDGSEFLEVVSTGTTAIVYHGMCAPQ